MVVVVRGPPSMQCGTVLMARAQNNCSSSQPGTAGQLRLWGVPTAADRCGCWRRLATIGASQLQCA